MQILTICCNWNSLLSPETDLSCPKTYILTYYKANNSTLWLFAIFWASWATVHRGKVSKAANRIVLHGIAIHADPNVKDQLQAKFPPKKKELQQTVKKLSPIDQFKNLRGTLLSIPGAVAPGSGGLWNEFLLALGERMQDDEMKWLDGLGIAYIRAQLHTWFYKVWLSTDCQSL